MTPAHARAWRSSVAAAVVGGALWLADRPAHAAAAPVAAPVKRAAAGPGSLLPGANSRAPISIDAGKLDYFDKDQKLIYTGDVVAKQGDSTLRATVLTIFLSKQTKPTEGKAAEPPADPDAQASPTASSSIRRMEAKGPVTVISKDEVGTGDNGSYDKEDNKIVLVGNVTLTQGTNIIKGDQLVYDMTTGHAEVSSVKTLSRVRSVFTPGSGTPGTGTGARKAAAPGTPKPDAAAAAK